MKLYLHSVSNNNGTESSYLLESTNNTLLELEDLDMVDFELEVENHLPSEDLSLVIGNTFFPLDEPIEVNRLFYYRVSLNFIQNYLPGFKAHVSKDLFTTLSGKRRFSRLFLNEIGLSKILILNKGVETYVGGIRVFSKKLTSDNFNLITEYLIFNGYFDSNFLYKVVLEGQQSDLPTSLLEALRKLLNMLKDWQVELYKFTNDPIAIIANEHQIKPFSQHEHIDSHSIEWLLENVENIQNSNSRHGDFSIRNKHFLIDQVLISEPKNIMDSYENRVIHGFISNFLNILSDKESSVASNGLIRTKVGSFREYLLDSFSRIVKQYFKDSKDYLLFIKNYFSTYLPVSVPIFEFPRKIDGFHSKAHYKNVLDLINFSRNIFSIDIADHKSNLEIESFDKLFEVYCFYLIMDIVVENFSDKAFHKNDLNLDLKTNKLAGRYSVPLNRSNIKLHLYYECLPNDMAQLTNQVFKPDFIIELERKGVSYYLILDAKYKSYSSTTLDADLATLTLKYLHKIGISSGSKNKVIGLYPISLSSTNRRKSVFRSDYDLYSSNVIFPQIGSIEVNPSSFDLGKNPILDTIEGSINCIELEVNTRSTTVV